MSTGIDTFVSVTILVLFALIIYSKYQNQKLIETLRGIKEILGDMKGGTEEVYEYGRPTY